MPCQGTNKHIIMLFHRAAFLAHHAECNSRIQNASANCTHTHMAFKNMQTCRPEVLIVYNALLGTKHNASPWQVRRLESEVAEFIGADDTDELD